MSTESYGEGLKKTYKDMIYDRDYVTNSDINDLISEVTGISRSDVDKIVFDGKVQPVIIINNAVSEFFSGTLANGLSYYLPDLGNSRLSYLNFYYTGGVAGSTILLRGGDTPYTITRSIVAADGIGVLQAVYKAGDSVFINNITGALITYAGVVVG